MNENIVFEYEDFKAGDVITTYYKGYYRIVNFERRFVDERLRYCHPELTLGNELSPYVYFQQVATSVGKLTKSTRTYSCTLATCNHASLMIDREVETLQNTIEALLKLKASL